MYMSNVSKNVLQTLMNTSCFVKSYFFDWGKSKLFAGKTKKSYFRFMQSLQFELINVQQNAFSSQVFASIMFS